VFAVVAACATAPKTASEKTALEAQADSTIREMTAKDDGLRPLLNQSVGYVVFPDVGQGGFIVGGAGGKGVVYEHGVPVGYAHLGSTTIGAQVGGQTFAELIIFKEKWALEQMKSGNFSGSATAGAVMVKAGASTTTNFEKGQAVFIDPKGGGMVEASVGAQRIKYESKAGKGD
jgi:lipid-binding SYLF domain-containing protein